MPSATYFPQATELKFSTMLLGWSTGTGEASSSLKALVMTYNRDKGYGGTNRGRYSNAKVDDLMKQQRIEADPAKRKDLLLQAQQIYTVDDPSRVWYGFGVSPLVTVKAVTGMNSYPDRIARFETAQLAK